MNSIIKRCLLSALVLPALAATGQPAGDSIPAKPNELNINLQFMGRGESRYGGMMPEDDAVFGDEEEASRKFRRPTSCWAARDWRLTTSATGSKPVSRHSIQECGGKPEREPSTSMRRGSR